MGEGEEMAWWAGHGGPEVDGQTGGEGRGDQGLISLAPWSPFVSPTNTP